MKITRTPCWTTLLAALATLGLATPALAGDGVIEINHAAAIAGGVSSSDAPGYPVTLRAGNSYRLSSDLRVSSGVSVIEGVVPTLLNQPNSNGSITLDLNGFSVRCFVGVIGPIGATCTGDAIGIDFTDIDGAVVKNGSVRGFGSHGVRLGDRGRIENVVASHNDDFSGGNTAGIYCGADCYVKGCTASNNGRYGIFTGSHSTIEKNRAYDNGQGGIRVGSYSLTTKNVVFGNDYQGITDSGYGNILQNQISQNGSLGIDALSGAPFMYGHNVLIGNNSGGNQVDFSGVPIETNYCQNSTVCP